MHTHTGHQILLQNCVSQSEQIFQDQNELVCENSKRHDMQIIEEQFPQNSYCISDHSIPFSAESYQIPPEDKLRN